jgi:hypothetical protein
MKKVIIKLFFISILFLIPKTIFALSLIGDTGKWFYSSIADSVSSIEGSLYSIDLVWQTGTKDKLNTRIGENCIKENLTEAEIKEIVTGWDLVTILNKIDDSCKWKDWSISVWLISKIYAATTDLHNETKETAEDKTKQIMGIGSTWVYADWIEENAPFDWIIDLKEIDKIIFTEETEAYEWMVNHDLSKELWNLLAKANEINRPNEDLNTNLNWNDTNNDTNNTYNELKNYDDSNSINLYSTYVCSIQNSDSWLNQNDTNSMTDSLLTWDNSSWLNNNSNLTSWEGYWWMSWDLPYPSSNYSPVDDNSVFPCDKFFCIDVEFITYNHKLLWWGGQDMSIESLISRSNEHLKKFSNTSLVQSKMTINNFELWLKDLNLSEIFHIWVEVTTEPIPILNLTYHKNKNEDWLSNDDPTIFELENQLKFYYESYWLDYTRRNDLSLSTKIESDRLAALNSQLTTPQYQTSLLEEYGDYEEQLSEQREVMREIIKNEVKIWIIWDFEKQFKELVIFTKSMRDFVTNVKSVIKNMKKIPTDSSAT